MPVGSHFSCHTLVWWVELRAVEPGKLGVELYPQNTGKYISRYKQTSFLIIVYLGIYLGNYDTQVGHSLWLFYHALTFAQAPAMTVHPMVESKMKKAVWRKRILVTQYIDVYTVMYWVYPSIYVWFLYFSFVVAFKLLSIVFKCTDTSPKHSILYFGGKGEKNYVRITNICNPWLY